ncbi:LCP family protein [Solicola sp. PLA-1-18]|uniref:LCP family protein n=1 Tax=Solicola sp. PLA-1-18 TaxID=3380532 RepID=UPI003B7CF2E5
MSARKGPGRLARTWQRWRGVARWKRWALTTLVGVLVVVLGTGAGLYLRFNANLDVTDINSDDMGDRPTVVAGPQQPITVLVIGSDTRKDVSGRYGADDGTKRSDALMMVHVSGDRKRIDAVQIPRDTMIERPACRDTDGKRLAAAREQINGVLDYGAPCLVKTVESLTDNRIDHYIEIDFRGFARMINALGGLPICLDQAMVDPRADLDLPAGEQELTGREALALARTRHAVGDGSDIGRLAHQQVVMSAVVQRAQSSAVLTRPDRLVRFVDAVTSSLTVDEGLDSVASLAGLAREVAEVPSKDITFATMPWAEDPYDVNRVVPASGAEPLFAKLASDLPIDGSDEPSATPTAEETALPSTPVTVLNAGGVGGSATSLANKLRTADVEVGEIGNAERVETTTIQHPDTKAGLRDAKRTAALLGLDDSQVEVADVTAVTILVGADSRTDPLTVEGGDPSASASPSEDADAPPLQSSKASQKACS